MLVKFFVNTGFAGAEHTSVEEVPDGTTDEELEEWAKDYCFERIEYGFKKVAAGDEDED